VRARARMYCRVPHAPSQIASGRPAPPRACNWATIPADYSVTCSCFERQLDIRRQVSRSEKEKGRETLLPRRGLGVRLNTGRFVCLPVAESRAIPPPEALKETFQNK
jgi:hypothetical protein